MIYTWNYRMTDGHRQTDRQKYTVDGQVDRER